jgi:hypothetical protein
MKVLKWVRKRYGERSSTHQVYKIRGYNRGIPLAALLGEHINIRLLQNNTRILQTTNIPAYASGCTRAEIHMRRPSCTGPVTNVYRLFVHGDVWAAASEAGNSAQTVMYGVMDSVTGREGIPPA